MLREDEIKRRARGEPWLQENSDIDCSSDLSGEESVTSDGEEEKNERESTLSEEINAPKLLAAHSVTFKALWERDWENAWRSWAGARPVDDLEVAVRTEAVALGTDLTVEESVETDDQRFEEAAASLSSESSSCSAPSSSSVNSEILSDEEIVLTGAEEPSGGDHQTDWACITCTYINAATVAPCEMCGSSLFGRSHEPQRFDMHSAGDSAFASLLQREEEASYHAQVEARRLRLEAMALVEEASNAEEAARAVEAAQEAVIARAATQAAEKEADAAKARAAVRAAAASTEAARMQEAERIFANAANAANAAAATAAAAAAGAVSEAPAARKAAADVEDGANCDPTLLILVSGLQDPAAVVKLLEEEQFDFEALEVKRLYVNTLIFFPPKTSYFRQKLYHLTFLSV